MTRVDEEVVNAHDGRGGSTTEPEECSKELHSTVGHHTVVFLTTGRCVRFEVTVERGTWEFKQKIKSLE